MIAVFGKPDPHALEQLERCAAVEPDARAVLCADSHVGYSQPIGGAVAYREHVSPSGVGYDIGCGNKAVLTELSYGEVRDDVARIMDEVCERVSFGVGRENATPVEHPVLDRIRKAAFEPQRELLELAASQLGTVGAGNHYVDLFRDERDRVWVGVHFGSRGFGHRTASGFLALAQGLEFGARAREGGMDAAPVVFSASSSLGEAYVEAMTLAGEYAYAGRDVVVDTVLDILGTRAVEEVHNHHNFCIAADQIVPTTDGPKRMDEVVVGDEVYAFSDQGPEPTRVLAHWSSGEKPIYAISVGSRRLRCSGRHPVMTITSGRVTWRLAEDLAVGDALVCADGYYPTDGRWGVDRARFVGAFLGDGWIRHDHVERRGYTVGLAIGTGKEAHTGRYADLAAKALPNTGWGSGWRIDVPGHFGLSCSSKSVWTAARALGLGDRADQKRVPPQAFSLPREEKLALLAGYFDADGSVANGATSNHGRGHVASTSSLLVRDLRELAIACGLQVTALRTELRTTNYGECDVTRFTIAADSMSAVPLWHADKAANLRTTARRTKGLSAQYLDGVTLPGGYFARRVRSIEVEDKQPVFDLTVEHPSHSFVVEGIVTHNCWREEHGGEDWWVVRKGCTPAFPGQRGFVGATMGGVSVILEGVESSRSEEALHSTVHGAGRTMSRTKAAGKLRTRRVGGVRRRVREGGVIDFRAVQDELAARGIELRGGAADEAPGAYKDLREVIAAHAGTVRVLHELRPIGVAMAPADTFDPYKD